MPSNILRREHLGGVALERNFTCPGHIVSWKFAEQDAAEKVAILVEHATRDHFRIVAFNTTDHVQHAAMTTWNVTAGSRRVKRGIDMNNSDEPIADISSITSELGRSVAMNVSLAPHATTVMEFTLEKSAATQPEQRANLGIGVDDVHVSHGAVTVTVHSLGARVHGIRYKSTEGQLPQARAGGWVEFLMTR